MWLFAVAFFAFGVFRTKAAQSFICENDKGTLSCADKPGTTLDIVYANYGRTSKEKCVHPKLPSKRTNCPRKEDMALRKVKKLCQDKTSCDLTANNKEFSDTCPGTYKYLQVDFRCKGAGGNFICENEMSTVSCANNPGTVLHFTFANYGRTSASICVHPKLPSKRTNCPQKLEHALSVVQNQCEGETTCSLTASNQVFTDTCPNTYKYLEVRYACKIKEPEPDPCTSSPCNNGGTCESRDSGYVCRCSFGWSGRHCTDRTVCECSASGDPHYKLFDGQMIHFQGVCTYKLAEVWHGDCGIIVHVKNIRSDWNPHVSFTKTVYIFVGNDSIVIARNRITTINGIFHSAPYATADYKIFKTGEYIMVRNKCGMHAMFDGNARVKVIVNMEDGPGAMGICGNCNNVKDDYRLSNGTDVSGETAKYSLIGNSYVVAGADDLNEECAKEDDDIICSEEVNQEIAKNQHCGYILDISGPFKECLSIVPAADAEMFYSFCAYDVCANWGNITTQVCSALETFVDYCYDNGAGPISFRTTDFCPSDCGDHMVYDSYITYLQPSCKDRRSSPSNTMPPEEGCVCISGFVLDNAMEQCIPESECGCLTADNYYPLGGSFTNENCSIEYTCVNDGHNPVLTETFLPGCGDNAECKPVDGDYTCLCTEGFTMVDGVCVEQRLPSSEPIVLTQPPVPTPQSTHVVSTRPSPPPPPPAPTTIPTDDVCERLKPCHNGGSCTNKGQGRYECCCLPEFSGKHCDVVELPLKPSGPHKECIENSDPKGLMYFGTQDTTTSGRKCQAWGSRYPHQHAYHEMLVGEENYCRNRLHGQAGRYRPWCFTTDPDKPWEYCDNIPSCSNPTPLPKPPTNPGCYNRTDKGTSYSGPVAYSASGKRCERWVHYPDNYCRNPHGLRDRPWCWTKTGKEDCAVDICALSPPVAGENACTVDTSISLCVSTLVLTGDCYYRHTLYQKCDFTVVRKDGNVYDIHMPTVTKELQWKEADGPRRHTDKECNVTFVVVGRDVLTIRYPVCGWCAKTSYESFMRDVVDGTHTCSGA